MDDVAAVNAQLSNGDVRHLGRVSRGAVRLAAKGLRASAGPRRTPSRFAPCALGLGKCRQELSRQESTLQYDVYNSAGLSDFLSPLNRLLPIIERLLPAPIEADLVLCHSVLSLSSVTHNPCLEPKCELGVLGHHLGFPDD